MPPKIGTAMMDATKISTRHQTIGDCLPDLFMYCYAHKRPRTIPTVDQKAIHSP